MCSVNQTARECLAAAEALSASFEALKLLATATLIATIALLLLLLGA
jgi:hypothetical protein